MIAFPELFQELADPWKYSLPEAVELANRLIKVEPTLDIKLARALPRLRREWAERALQILDEISEGRRIVPFMNHLACHDDARIAAKSVLVMGKRLQEPDWSRQRLAAAKNSRLRANAIETLWGVSSKPALKLFNEALTDTDHRVVGNSLIALHLAEQPDIPEIVLKTAGAANPQFRTMASWVMGKIGDPKFIPRLTELVRDPDPAVRSTALRALRKMRRRAQQNDSQIGDGEGPPLMARAAGG